MRLSWYVNLIELEYGRYGKPHLRSCPGVHFNLSHTRTAVMCAVSDVPVGCDVQRRCELPARDALFERRILHHRELALIGSSKGGRRRRLLTLFWTLKEAYTKQRGTGLVANIAGYDFSPLVSAYLDTDARKDVPWHARMFGLDFALYERGDCALCACAAHALHWEGQPGFRKTPGNRHGKTLPKSRPED
ncbi:MAG: 4'-phosphopantetheinyl transferase superfamily protein [Coriobacteriales bacterium]|nr:4'-phosphopantetheinyl transferase superfamily protein [Coriobacteriales bacterium]